MIEKIASIDQCDLYELPNAWGEKIFTYITTTPQTREICNDPRCLGIDYTSKLQQACGDTLKALSNEDKITLQEKETIVFNILRGGLNFGLRDALAQAFGWNAHSSSFISAQRRRRADNPDEWEITEGDYHKLYLKPTSSIVFGDVVATGTSLEHALDILIHEAEQTGCTIKNMIFFTIGGIKTEAILARTAKRLTSLFLDFEGIHVVYIEGRFIVPDHNTPLTIKLTGTDLVRLDAVMAPEFIASQYENPCYPIERCTIYDAGSRAFLISEYAEDVLEYWQQNLELAEQGMTFTQLVNERFPEIDATRYANTDLKALSIAQIEFFSQYI